MEKKFYSIRVIPEVPVGVDAEGKPKDPIYIRRTNPSDATKALKDEDGNPLFPPQRTMHLELFEEDEQYVLGGDTKPYTLNIFENSDSLLFDKLEELMATEGEYSIMATKRKTMKLVQKLPGLVRTRPAPEHKATFLSRKTNKPEVLMATKRQPNGDFLKEPVILNKVQYFLFANQVNEEDDAVRYTTEIASVRPWMLNPDNEQTVADAKVSAEKKDEPVVEKPETAPIE